jgi:hypothetical protein
MSAANFAVLSLGNTPANPGSHTALRCSSSGVIVIGHAFGVAAHKVRAQGAQRRRQRRHAATVGRARGHGSVAVHPPGTAPGVRAAGAGPS